MLEAEGQRRALQGLAQTNNDALRLLHGKMVLCTWPVDAGFPTLNDRDSSNPGRGERVVTWRATIPASMVWGNVAESVQVVDGGGQVVVYATFPLPIHKEDGKQLLVYTNEHIR